MDTNCPVIHTIRCVVREESKRERVSERERVREKKE